MIHIPFEIRAAVAIAMIVAVRLFQIVMFNRIATEIISACKKNRQYLAAVTDDGAASALNPKEIIHNAKLLVKEQGPIEAVSECISRADKVRLLVIIIHVIAIVVFIL